MYSADKKQNVFVANRAAEILEASSTDEWKHIRGELNPSDIGTRGTTIAKLSESEWLSGPSWLKNEPESVGLYLYNQSCRFLRTMRRLQELLTIAWYSTHGSTGADIAVSRSVFE